MLWDIMRGICYFWRFRCLNEFEYSFGCSSMIGFCQIKSERDKELHNLMLVSFAMVLWSRQCILLEIVLLLMGCGNQLYQQGPRTLFFDWQERGGYYGILRMKVICCLLMESSLFSILLSIGLFGRIEVCVVIEPSTVKIQLKKVWTIGVLF